MSFLELLLAPQCLPFSLSVALFLFITVLEVILVWLGSAGSFGVDLSLDVDVPSTSDLGNIWFLDWLGVGRVPYLVSIAALLLSFGMFGLFAQTLQFEVLGTAVPWPLIAVGSALFSLPVVRVVNLGLGRIWPREVESSAVTHDSLIGLQGVVVMGTVTSADPGQIKARDPQGTLHYGLAISDVEGDSVAPGQAVLIVGRRNAFYRVIRHPNPLPPEF